MRWTALIPVVPLAFACGAAWGQAQEFRLGDEGWAQVEAPEPGSDAAVIAEARRHVAEGRPDKAKRMLNRWIEEHERTDNPYLPEAYLVRGDAWVADDNEYEALYDYETVINDFPASPAFPEAIEREYEIGRAYVNGLRRKIWKWSLLRLDSAVGLGEELLIRVQERMPGSRLAERAALTLAENYYRRRQMRLASEMYGIYLANFPQTERREEAQRRQIYANVARFKGPRYDASPLIESEALIRRFQAEHPAEAEATGINQGLLVRIDESAAQQVLETARWYLQVADEPSALFTMRRLLRKHPESAAAQEAYRIMVDRGWAEPPPEEPDPDVEAGAAFGVGADAEAPEEARP